MIAAPYLDGAGFHHSVIFLSRAEKGRHRPYLNHPAGMNVGDVAPIRKSRSLYAVPIFKGGPVEHQLIFAAFPHGDKLRVQFICKRNRPWNTGRSPPSCALCDRGWTPPQLRRELNDRAWYVSPWCRTSVWAGSSGGPWLQRLFALHHIMSHAPAQPSLN
ncbi:MAG: YqgE/AlgH family protein [Akkermansia muciniphila]